MYVYVLIIPFFSSNTTVTLTGSRVATNLAAARQHALHCTSYIYQLRIERGCEGQYYFTFIDQREEFIDFEIYKTKMQA